ncbi:MAG: HTH domain-containing protein, partial [Nanoarchaeota archaeon]|nr:HTH domain-containing protein [Nanoarchaeota archaeon]
HSARTHYSPEESLETPQEPQNDLEKVFFDLKNYEFKTFLVIYQLDQEKGRANYYEIAQKMGVSDACVRSYVSSLLRKGVPILKTKLNKNRTVLSINPSFKSLDTHQRLLALYYRQNDYGQQASLSSF